MIKNKLILALLLAASLSLPTAIRAASLEIHVGDRPFYNHGARYWDGDYERIWVAGHREHGHWVHGHYARGQHRHGHHNNYRHGDRHGDRHDGHHDRDHDGDGDRH
ncbi:MAG: hypothetical protein ACR2HH_00130 [Chthoniobacterales bacterium]